MRGNRRKTRWKKPSLRCWAECRLVNWPQMAAPSPTPRACARIQVSGYYCNYYKHYTCPIFAKLCHGLNILIVFIKGKPGKKSFMYFASSAGRGFIISDDEEVTGVISVRNKESLLRFKIFISCLGCCMCFSCIISRVPQYWHNTEYLKRAFNMNHGTVIMGV